MGGQWCTVLAAACMAMACVDALSGSKAGTTSGMNPADTALPNKIFGAGTAVSSRRQGTPSDGTNDVLKNGSLSAHKMPKPFSHDGLQGSHFTQAHGKQPNSRHSTVENAAESNNVQRQIRPRRQAPFDLNHPPNVTHKIRSIIWDYISDGDTKIIFGKHMTPDNVDLTLNIMLKSVSSCTDLGLETRGPRVKIQGAISCHKNDKDIAQTFKTTEVIDKVSTTYTSTIAYTSEISGEVEIPLALKKIAMKFSRTSTTSNAYTKETSRKLPSHSITVKPRSREEVETVLYTQTVINKYLIDFELDEDSTYSVNYDRILPTDVDVPIERKNLKRTLERLVGVDTGLYSTYQYCGNTPCIEFRKNKVYLKNYLLEMTVEDSYQAVESRTVEKC